MAFSLLLLACGLLLLLVGAKFLVDGVSGLARAAGIPPLVVGLTVVAFGTSTPEVVINGISAWKGQTGLAFGNVVGSCVINIGFVLAVTAIIRPLAVQATVITREIPLLLLGVAMFGVMSCDVALNHATQDVLTRGDGLVLLLLFCVFLYSIFRQAMERRTHDPFVAEVVEAEASPPGGPGIGVQGVISLAGLVGVAVGGRLAVTGAVGIAQKLGIPEVVIGLTIVSFGTTLPELATSIIAVRKGQTDLAIGNVVGSNIYNLLFIGGMVATIGPVPIPPGGHVDLAAMAGLSVALLPIALRQRRVTRGEGVCLLGIYLAYAVCRAVGSV